MTVSAILALSTLQLVPVQFVSGFASTRVHIDGETHLTVIEPLNSGTEFRADRFPVGTRPSRTQIGEYQFFTRFTTRGGDITRIASFGDLDQRGVTARLGAGAFRDFIVGMDYFLNSLMFLPESEKGRVDQWVREGAEGEDLVRLKLRQVQPGVYAFPSFQADGMRVNVLPQLLSRVNIIRPPSEPRHLPRGRNEQLMDSFVGREVRSYWSLWRDIRVGEIHLPLFPGIYPEKEPPANSEFQGFFPLSALGPRRIAWDPERAELVFVKPTRIEVIEALLRTNVVSFSLDIAENRIFAGRPAVLDSERELGITGARVVSIGNVDTEKVLETMRGPAEEWERMLQDWLELRRANSFSLVVLANGRSIRINIARAP